MAVAGCNADGYIRCCKALHLVVHQCIPCVDNVLRSWHATMKQSLPPCSRPRPRPPSSQECSDRGKPKPSSSCSNCVAWGKAVEDVYYPQTARGNMPWGNVNPMCLSKSHVEVAKAFVLRLQKDTQFTKLDQFDAASLLMIMMRFEEFHRADQIKFDIIKEVSDIRNRLCHMQLEDNLHLESQQVEDIFSAIDDLVSCLQKLHPQWFTAYHAQDLRRQLNETKTGPVTAQMKEILEEFSTTIGKVVQHTIQEEVKGIKEILISPDQYAGQKSFDAQTCRNQLMAEYRQTRSKLPLLPGMPEECADMDDLYVELELIKEEKKTIEVEKTKLSSQEHLLTLKDKRGNDVKRILVSGGPGSGKSSTISKLAYDWANQTRVSAYTQFQMLFALDLREIQSGMNLIDAILDQLLPKVSKEELMSYIEAHADSIVFLLDGFDEASYVLSHGDIKHLLNSKWLQESLVIVTTRPYKVAEFVTTYGAYTHFQLTGFSEKHMREYVLRFLQVQSYSQYICIAYGINQDIYSQCTSWFRPYAMHKYTPEEARETVQYSVNFLNQLVVNFPDLCQIPITLSMLCLLWRHNNERLPKRVTHLYNDVAMHFAKHKQVKYEKRELDMTFLQQALDGVLLKIGEAALNGLFQDKLIFLSSEFDESILDKACQFGILSRERKQSKMNPIHHVTFVHKTFQEFCAAVFWSNLLENNKEIFPSYLNQIHTDNVNDMEKLLVFCCGKSREAADVILPHVVQLSCDLIRNFRYRFPIPFHGQTHLPVTERVTTDNVWDIPLSLLYESNMHHMHTHLLPLFQQSFVSIEYVNRIDKLNAFNFFLDCVLQAPTSSMSIYKDLTEVDISIWEWSSVVEQTLVKHLSCMRKFSSLRIGPYTAKLLLDVLIKHSCMPIKTTITRVTVINIEFRVPTMVTLLNQFTSLKKLSLFSNKSNTAQLLSAIEHYKLTELKLHHYAPQSLDPFVPTLHTLKLSVDESECEELFSTFVQAGRALNSKQSSSNKIDGEPPNHLPCEHLTLNSPNVSINAARKVAEAFIHLGNLHTLCFRGLLSSEASTIVIKGLYRLPKLTELHLHSSHIDAIGELLISFKYLTKLINLNLSKAHLNEESISQISSCLVHMPDLQILNLIDNQIGTAMTDLCQALQHLTQLRKLYLSNTNITDEGVCALPLTSFTNMEEIDLLDETTNYGSQSVEYLFRNLPHMVNLSMLFVNYNIDWNPSNVFLKGFYEAHIVEKAAFIIEYPIRVLDIKFLKIYTRDYWHPVGLETD